MREIVDYRYVLKPQGRYSWGGLSSGSRRGYYAIVGTPDPVADIDTMFAWTCSMRRIDAQLGKLEAGCRALMRQEAIKLCAV